ncbi:MAG: MotA/TolQ/ExbB proton channel family protein [Verrucomicrobium sp.]|nr:MotA/TolQ/ExbB proton channel family protein [Verrucomicrobium sp.]
MRRALFISLSAAFLPSPAFAQDGSAALAGGATLGDFLGHAGPVFWICVLLAAVVTALAVEGFLKWRFRALVPAEEQAQLAAFLAAGAYMEAWEYCRARRSFFSAVAAAGLERMGRGRDAVEFALEDAAIEQAVLLRTPLHYLSAIGVVAPMIGLAGTVLGMIRALAAMAQSGTGDYAALSGAIGQVLVSTEAGLAVAIPAFGFYYFFKARAQVAVLQAERVLFALFDQVPYESLGSSQ